MRRQFGQILEMLNLQLVGLFVQLKCCVVEFGQRMGELRRSLFALRLEALWLLHVKRLIELLYRSIVNMLHSTCLRQRTALRLNGAFCHEVVTCWVRNQVKIPTEENRDFKALSFILLLEDFKTLERVEDLDQLNVACFHVVIDMQIAYNENTRLEFLRPEHSEQTNLGLSEKATLDFNIERKRNFINKVKLVRIPCSSLTITPL